MNRLSSPIDSIRPHYDVIVIGSGYGGAIAASRLSRAGKRVCVLERGKERHPGEYPATLLEAADELQTNLPAGHTGPRTGLYDLHVDRDISVLVGCGLGGTSLINASVSLRPEPRVLADPRWPAALRAEQGRRLDRGFALAEQMLGANPFPPDRPQPPKLTALRSSAAAMGQKFSTPPINVTFTAGHNSAGVWQRECALCGDCVSGCNHGAKNTVLMNYLPDAKRHGAELFVAAGVRRVEPAAHGRGWTVHFQALGRGRETYDAPTLFVTADIVMLAAGALGSTEILLRSREAGKLSLSDRIGHGFSGNGDVLGFGYNCASEVRSVGLGPEVAEGSPQLGEDRAIGPTITGIIDMRGNPDMADDIVVAEGVIPAILAPILPAVEQAAAHSGTNTAPAQQLAQRARAAESLLRGAYHGATRHTQTYLAMGHDGSDGTMALTDDRLRIRWPGVGGRPVFAAINDRLVAATRPLAGIYMANPLWREQLGRSLITVHPLGGCGMADSAEHGVVDHRGKVFASSSGAAVHEGLYVCDGAILPTAVGVNPLLTISALAERCCMIMAEERGFTIDYSAKGPLPVTPERRAVGIHFTEAMKGWISPSPELDHEHAAALGKTHGASFEFIVTIASTDVHAMITGAGHEGRMVGTARAPSLSPAPLLVTQGLLNLLVADEAAPGGHQLRYRMLLTTDDGRNFLLTGFKTLRDRPFWELWHDATTLYITVHEGTSDAGAVVGKGTLSIAPDDLIRLLSTFEVTNAATRAARFAATVGFGRFFAGALYDHYGGLVLPSKHDDGEVSFSADEAPEPRERRPLRVCAPRFVPLHTVDGATILLTRHDGGTRGPVMLVHSPGASSHEFSSDLLATNLLECLYEAGHDVWLLDDRSSLLLPASAAAITEDALSADLKLAAAAVLELTGSACATLVTHEFAAISFALATPSGVAAAYARDRALTLEPDDHPRILARITPR